MTEFDVIMMMVVVADALAVVLHVLHHRVIQQWHAAIFYDPMIEATGWATLRHLRKKCADCSMAAALTMARIHGAQKGSG